jgi:hypothetical protein
MLLEGQFEEGRVVFDPPVDLPNGTKVRVEVIPSAAEQSADQSPTLYERLRHLVGKAQHLPPDASINHDHYLYGTPKQSP